MADTGTRRDPLPVYCFQVKLIGVGNDAEASAFFKSISGIKYETDVTDFAEGGENSFTHRLVGATKWANLILKRGFSKSFDLIKWREDWIKGRGRRAQGEIIQLATDLTRVCAWKFKDGWPTKWELSEFDASKSELAIETLEIAHHGLEFVG